jgi:hypothetical protein
MTINRQHPRTPRTEQRAREAFLAGLAGGMSVTGSCRRAGLPRSTVYDWRGADPEFARQWEEAIESGTDLMEDEAVRRAVYGVPEPVVSMGRVVKNDDGSTMTVNKYSDQLLTRLLIARRREKFGDRVAQEIKHSGDANNPILLAEGSARDYLMAKIAALAENLKKRELVEGTLATGERCPEPPS